MGIEAVDKYLYLLAGNKIQKSLMDFIQELECTFHKKFTHSILLKLLIHTACLIERTLINGHELKIISEYDTRPSHETIFHVKRPSKILKQNLGLLFLMMNVSLSMILSHLNNLFLCKLVFFNLLFKSDNIPS